MCRRVLHERREGRWWLWRGDKLEGWTELPSSRLLLIKIIRGSIVSILSVSGTLEAVLSRQRSVHCPKLTHVGVDLKDTIELHIVAQQSMADSIKEGQLMLGRECIRFESNEECENPLGRDDEGGWLLFLKGRPEERRRRSRSTGIIQFRRGQGEAFCMDIEDYIYKVEVSWLLLVMSWYFFDCQVVWSIHLRSTL